MNQTAKIGLCKYQQNKEKFGKQKALRLFINALIVALKEVDEDLAAAVAVEEWMGYTE